MRSSRLLFSVVVLGGFLLTDPVGAFSGVDADALSAFQGDPSTLEQVAQSPVEVLSLQDAIALALAHNPGAAAAGWEAAAAKARRGQVSAERLPRITLAGSYTRHLDEQRLLPVRQPGDPAVLSRDILSGDVLFSMPLLTGGRLPNQIEAAALSQDAARNRVTWTREDLIYQVTSLFYDILAQEKVIESLVFSRHTMQEHLKRVHTLISARKAAEVDRLRSEVRLANVDHLLAQERARLAILKETFAGLLGGQPKGDGISLAGPLAEPAAIELAEPSVAVAQAFAARADYAAEKFILASRARNVDAAKGSRWPSLLLFASYGGRRAVGDWTGSGEELDDTGRAGIALEVPIFEGGRISARIGEQRALLAVEQERLRRLELQIDLEVTSALLNVDSARKQVSALSKAIDQAKESLRIEQQKYELGKGAVTDVLDAQSALLYSQTSYYRALADLHASLARLRLATGQSGHAIGSADEPRRRTP